MNTPKTALEKFGVKCKTLYSQKIRPLRPCYVKEETRNELTANIRKLLGRDWEGSKKELMEKTGKEFMEESGNIMKI